MQPLRLRIIAIALGLVAAGGAWSPAHACSCMSSGPACQAFWTTTAVFDATVIAIEDIQMDELLGSELIRFTRRLVKLEVRHAWKGVSAGPLEVITNPSEASCGFEFRVSGRYLIFADDRRFAGRISVSRCSLTQSFDATGDAALFLASLETMPTGGRAFGTVTLSQRGFGTTPDIYGQPVELPVRLRGAGQTLTTEAIDGKYRFEALEPGRYEVSIVGPEGYSGWGPGSPIEIPNNRACAETNFSISPDGRITGRVIDARGRGVPSVRVEATGADAPVPEYCAPEMASSDPDGFFELRSLPPGRYLVGLNLRDLPSEYNPYPRVLYPGDSTAPHVVELSLGQVADLGQWTLPPPLEAVRISGMVVWGNGTPASGVYVGIWDSTGNAPDRLRGAGGAAAGADGRFHIDGREGREYSFTVRSGPRHVLKISAPRITARNGLEPVRIVIRSEPGK